MKVRGQIRVKKNTESFMVGPGEPLGLLKLPRTLQKNGQ